MSLLGWVVGAALFDEWGRREEEGRERQKRDRELMERDWRIRELEGRISRLETDGAMRGRDAPTPKDPWRWRG